MTPRALTTLGLCLGLTLAAGCHTTDAGDEGLGPAPDFTATDVNPGSATYGMDLSLSETHGTVVVLYFVNYS